MIKYIAAADVLVGCNVESDLRSIGFTEGDYIAVRQKVRDVGLFYSPRLNGQPMSLRHLVYLHLGVVIQDNRNKHSPGTDAIAAMWLYMYRMDEIEKQFRERSSNQLNWRKHESGFFELRYEPNKETSRLYREYFAKRNDWPIAIRKDKRASKWNDQEFVNPDEVKMVVQSTSGSRMTIPAGCEKLDLDDDWW